MKPRLFDGEHQRCRVTIGSPHVAAMKPRLFDGEHTATPGGAGYVQEPQ